MTNNVSPTDYWKYNAEYRLTHGMVMAGDPPLRPMSDCRQKAFTQALASLDLKPLALYERDRVPAATGSDRCLCYVGVEASNGQRWAFLLNRYSMEEDPDPVLLRQDISDHLTGEYTQYPQWRPVPWDGVTPIDEAACSIAIQYVREVMP